MADNTLITATSIDQYIDRPPRPLFLLLRVAGWLLFAAGVCTSGITIQLIRRSYSPTPFADQWVPLDGLSGGLPWLSLSSLWRQHNEHRIPLSRLSLIVDLK